MSETLHPLASRPVGRLLWEYSLPAVVGLLVMSMYNVVDRIFIGQGVGPEAIAGLAVTFPVMNLTTAIGTLVGVGGSARASIAMGGGDRQAVALYLGNSVTLTVVNAAVYITVFALFMEPILRAFGASDVTMPYAYDVVMYLLPGLFLTNVTYGLNNFIRATGYPVTAMVTMLIGAGVNLVLAPLFIFVLDMGIRGAAIATDISMAVGAMFVVAHFLRRDVSVRFTRGSFGLRWHIVLAIISIGAAPALVNTASCCINILINRNLYAFGGDMAIGAAGIFVTVSSLVVMVVLGICQGMQPVVGYNYGAGDFGRVRRAFLMASAAGTVVCTIGWAVVMTAPALVARVFTADASLISTTAPALRTAMAVFPIVAVQIVATTYFQSIGKSGRSIFLSLTRQVLFLIPMLMLLPRFHGLTGIWMSFPASDILATAVTILLLYGEVRRTSRSV